ncbi:hypothetical protein COCON_G00100710 [Conger conger]|uniref:P2X purinoceptor n=1 Tax=Conger conger TaxID=82655 RepID=A0A9Q1HZB5_CONCO|nr:hypothetical protein COCON_G00100710 [Conger conger]
MMGCITDFFTYGTTKSVVVKSWTIGIINRVVQLLILIYFIGWVFLHEKAYQVRDTAIESSVMTKVKGFGVYSNRLMDVADYVTPTQGSSVFCIITKLITTENQVQSWCPETETKYRCNIDQDCVEYTGKAGGNGVLTGRCVTFNSSLRTCEMKGWCPAEIDDIKTDPMMEVENFTIFIKNSIRFPLFNFTKGNFLPTITADYIKNCKFNLVDDTYCPIFRVGDVVKFAHQDFSSLAHKKNNVSPGYNFRYAKYYKMENGTEYRTLLKAYAIRFDVLVNGNAGKFNMIPTLINMVAAFTSVGVGTVLCDIILLNFLKGAEQYKAKKFEEVSESQLRSSDSNSNGLYRNSCSQLSVKQDEKVSSDSGAFSIGQCG